LQKPALTPLPLYAAPATEPSALVGFAGNRVDRQAEKRTADSAALALADPQARLYLIAGGRLFLKHDGGAFDPLFTRGEAAVLEADFANAVLLGADNGVPVLAVPPCIQPEALPERIKAIDHRSVYVQGLVPPDQLGALAQGAALLAWNASHRFCGRCGHETRDAAGGYKRACTGCGAEHFPRSDPVAIMLAVAGDRCLLGRGAHFAEGMYSCLAGFIEPGETIENAVRREIFEESGIRTGRVAYYASQPWPFPHSLMIGCHAEATSRDISFDTAELQDCRWFSRQEVRQLIAGTHPDGLTVPPSGAIATHLMRSWVES
jgi:NAD+ diphosphatase